ncbi:ATP-binding protein [bacterium]|nr:ATP-binding protein [bacterium]
MRVRQVLWNLLGNAIKFTQTGDVSIDVRTTFEKGALLEISVKDTGIGMTSSQVKSIFEPFSQADNSTTRRFGVSGLGLTICKQLANAMNGDLQVRSSLGKGSEFLFTFPLSIVSHNKDWVESLNLKRYLAILVGNKDITQDALSKYLNDLEIDYEYVHWNKDFLCVLADSGNDCQDQVLVVPMEEWIANPVLSEAILREVEQSSSVRIILLKRRSGNIQNIDLPRGIMELKCPIRLKELTKLLDSSLEEANTHLPI